MSHYSRILLVSVTLLFLLPSAAHAQQFMYWGPFGPVCMGPHGPGHCDAIADFLRRRAANAWNDVRYGPGRNNFFGSNGPVQQRMGDINRGANDIMRGRAPGPAVLGTVNGRRVCIPWC
jgi:hypothetical protein